MVDESYWTFKASSKTPDVVEAIWCGAVPCDTSQSEWEKLSPGFRREIVKWKIKQNNLKITLD